MRLTYPPSRSVGGGLRQAWLRGLATHTEGARAASVGFAATSPAAQGRILIALTLAAATAGCATQTACLANRYDSTSPKAQCISGLQLPYNILKDTDPMSGSAAPVTVAQ